jgi:UTP--glucose-1-phosphate uridylyltransferase
LVNTKIKKVVIPVAGMGTRFLPATKSQPKEMLPIVDKPCIQYIVEEAVASGIEEIIIITGRNKRSIEDHFDYSFELSERLKAKGKKEELKEIEKIESLAKIFYVRQPFPGGDGHAILCAKELIKDEPFAVLFGDDIFDSKTPALAQLIKQYNKYQTPIIGVHEVDKKETNKYGIVETKDAGNVTSLIEKPNPEDAPSNLAITGKYIVTPELLAVLEKANSHSKDQEIRLIDGLIDYLNKGAIHAHKIEGIRFDTGDKSGYLEAVIHFALKHKDLAVKLKSYLKGLNL